jgi:hypothetical protein
MIVAANPMIRGYALGLIDAHGGILEAYSFAEYILTRMEQRICLFGMNKRLLDEYEFYADVLDYMDAMIRMN